MREYEKTILDELDLMREAGNASQLRRNFEGSTLLYVPAVHWDFCRPEVMVLERIRGVQISNMARLREAGTDIRRLAENGVEIFFTQVFKHNFFHADMHPGNIFVLIDNPAQPKYAAVDFGIVGTLDPRDQYYLAENFLAVFDRDYRRVATLHLESGWVPEGSRVDEMESAIRTVCEPIFNKPLKEISFGTVLLRLFEISRRFNVEIQPQLILLQKTLLNIEGLGRDLYPGPRHLQDRGPHHARLGAREDERPHRDRERARADPGDHHQPADAGAAGALGRAARAGRPPAPRGGGARDQRAAQRDQAHQPPARQGDHRRRRVVGRHRLAGARARAGRGPAGRWRARGVAWLIVGDPANESAPRVFCPATLHMIGDGIANSSVSIFAMSACSCCCVSKPAAMTSLTDLLEVHAHEFVPPLSRSNMTMRPSA